VNAHKGKGSHFDVHHPVKRFHNDCLAIALGCGALAVARLCCNVAKTHPSMQVSSPKRERKDRLISEVASEIASRKTASASPSDTSVLMEHLERLSRSSAFSRLTSMLRSPSQAKRGLVAAQAEPFRLRRPILPKEMSSHLGATFAPYVRRTHSFLRRKLLDER
jgi:hypothetical protein